MHPFVQLLCVVLAMAAGTTVFGALPLVLPLARAKLRYIELIGSGLLLGAAFTVVIPEGIATVIRAADALRRLPQSLAPSGSTTNASLLQQRGWTVASHLQQAPTAPPPQQPQQQSPLWRFVTDGETVVGSMLLLGFFLMFMCVLQKSPRTAEPRLGPAAGRRPPVLHALHVLHAAGTLIK